MDRMARAAQASGRDPGDITLVAVTKTVDVPAMREAVQAGVTDVGENYVQDGLRKYDSLGGAVRWHMIGHLQTNKVKHAVPMFDLIHSVDDLSLAQEIGKRSVALGKVCEVLVEVNISCESSKFGAQPMEALDLCEQVASVEGVALKGLMGMAPFVDDPGRIRKSFARLRELWERLPVENRVFLSMGMTADFELAIEEGSNMVRVGTAIFGPRR